MQWNIAPSNGKKNVESEALMLQREFYTIFWIQEDWNNVTQQRATSFLEAEILQTVLLLSFVFFLWIHKSSQLRNLHRSQLKNSPISAIVQNENRFLRSRFRSPLGENWIVIPVT